MNYGSKDVMNLYIFNEEGELVVTLDTLQKSHLKIDVENNISEIFIKDALLNLDFLKFVQDSQDEKLTDFERYSKLSTVQTVKFNTKTAYKTCKVIAKGLLRDASEGKDVINIYEIPNAKILKNFNMIGNVLSASVFDSLIKIEPYNEDGDLFKIHIQQ